MSPQRPTAVRTDVGGHRERNEDAARTGAGWWVVADGMGGHVGGEVASVLVAEAVRERLTRLLEDSGEASPEADAAQAAVFAAVEQGAAALRERGRTEPELATMGTTLVVAVETASGLLVVHLGDSRAYLLVDGALTRLTRDDNVAEEMVALGMISADQAQTHPGQYQLTKAVTAYDAAAPAGTAVLVAPRGRLLLCSDGLNGELSDETIAGLLALGSPDDAAQALLDAALRAPARDNVTVVVADLGR